ncbi:MAG: Excinuclease ABC C subunit domain protein [Candidatus Nomurabacteria bacterium GW2011_GWA1_40_8]|nr:MAG: Excinuclease ABC C subunit domain protein [Candidatus Nomurabacteria bacterium GW2011_GWA1_40_8]
MIMFYVYILKSLKDDKLYIGSTNDLKRRLSEHNKGLNRSTKARRPFEIRYYEACKSEDDARTREYMLKKDGKALGQLKKRISESLQ